MEEKLRVCLGHCSHYHKNVKKVQQTILNPVIMCTGPVMPIGKSPKHTVNS